MSKTIRDHFVRDIQVAGLSEGMQARYLPFVNGFMKACWVSQTSATERPVQYFVIGLREEKTAR